VNFGITFWDNATFVLLRINESTTFTLISGTFLERVFISSKSSAHSYSNTVMNILISL